MQSTKKLDLTDLSPAEKSDVERITNAIMPYLDPHFVPSRPINLFAYFEQVKLYRRKFNIVLTKTESSDWFKIDSALRKQFEGHQVWFTWVDKNTSIHLYNWI